MHTYRALAYVAIFYPHTTVRLLNRKVSLVSTEKDHIAYNQTRTQAAARPIGKTTAETARLSASAAAAYRPELLAYFNTDIQEARAIVTATWCTMNDL